MAKELGKFWRRNVPVTDTELEALREKVRVLEEKHLDREQIVEIFKDYLANTTQPRQSHTDRRTVTIAMTRIADELEKRRHPRRRKG